MAKFLCILLVCSMLVCGNLITVLKNSELFGYDLLRISVQRPLKKPPYANE